MQTFRLVVAMAVALLAHPWLGRAACVSERCTSAAAVDNLRSLVASACDCAGTTSRAKYLKCARQVIRAAVRDGSLPAECRAGVQRCEVQSTCGQPDAAVCCVQRKGRVKAKLLRKRSRCPGNECSGAMSLAEACSAEAQCRPARRGIRAFKSIQKVFQTSCALGSCHSAFARKGGLVLDSEDVSYASLVGRASVLEGATDILRVKPGDPNGSFLVRKLRGEGPGDLMPQGAPPLPAAVITMVEDWINRGAKSTAEECQAGSSVCEPDDTPIGDYVWKPEPPLDPPAPGTGIQLYIPPKDVEPGKEWETCYAFHPNWNDVAALAGYTGGALPTIKEQVYRMHQGSHHLLLYAYYGQHPEDFKLNQFFDCFAATCLNPAECPSDIDQKLPFGGTQVAGTRYEVSYPEGVGIPVLGRNTVMIANLHYTNPFQPQQPVYGEAWLNLYFAAQGETKAILDGIFAINFPQVEPFTTRVMSRIWQPRSLISRQPADAAVFQLFGHMHKRGTAFQIDSLKGAHCSASPTRVCGRDDDCPAGETCNRTPQAEDSTIYYTTSWDHAPVVNYPAPYLLVNRDEGLRWTCTHTNGIAGDPTRPPRRCAAFGCEGQLDPTGQVTGDDCYWDATHNQCVFAGDPPRVFAEGEPMPLVFGELADDDMCNMFGYFVNQADLVRISGQ